MRFFCWLHSISRATNLGGLQAVSVLRMEHIVKNETATEKTREYLEMVMHQLRREDPDYDGKPLIDLIMYHPEVAQIVYEIEYDRLAAQFEDAPCGVDSQHDTPKRITYPPGYRMDEDVYIQFCEWNSRADGRTFVEIVNAASKVFEKTGELISYKFAISSEYEDQCYVVAMTSDRVMRLQLYTDHDEVALASCEILPSNKILEQHIMDTTIEHMNHV